jgi:hypothetical protein
MQPSHAEIARTLAAGNLPADTHIACRPGPFPVRHVTDPEGRVLILAPTGGALATALRPAPGNDDTALVLEVADLPPAAGAPSLGRVWVAGWAGALSGDAARAAAMAYAEVDPAPDLLDVGRGQTLHRVEVAEVRLEHAGTTFDVDPGEYAAATPDPLHPAEFDLLADLNDHHGAEVSGYLRREFGARRGDARVVRVDRYGLLVRLGSRLSRLTFPRPVRSRTELAALLHPVLCRRCA